MFSANELKKEDYIVVGGEPYVILDKEHSHMQQRRAVVRLKIKNLKNGKVLDKSFQSSDSLEEADILKEAAVFIYSNRNEYWFHKKGDPSARFSLGREAIGDLAEFLKPKMEVVILVFGEKIININLPVKAEYKVVEAPPAIKGVTAAGGTKQVKIESGAAVNVPMFIEEGDKIIVNTKKGEYVGRVS